MYQHVPYEFWLVTSFFLGLIFGSFFNVCILRIPNHKSIVMPPSHCPNCNYELKWYDNIPILSYIILRGKCRNCKSAISPRYAIIEFLTGVLFAFTFYRFGFNVYTIFALIFISFMIIMSFIDLDHFILPDRFTLTLIPLGILSSFFKSDFNWIDSITGLLVGGGFILIFSATYYLVRKRSGMGGGDMKLMAGVGAYLGFKLALLTLMIGTIAGTMVAIPYLLIKKKKMDSMLPFGPFLALAAVICLFWGEEIFNWWLRHPIIDFRAD
jgi:leader peptidase (prepilin peptidase)/N-methyltransferase